MPATLERIPATEKRHDPLSLYATPAYSRLLSILCAASKLRAELALFRRHHRESRCGCEYCAYLDGMRKTGQASLLYDLLEMSDRLEEFEGFVQGALPHQGRW